MTTISYCFSCRNKEEQIARLQAQLTEARATIAKQQALMERVVRRWSGSSEGLMADIYAIDDMAKYLDKC